MYLRTTNFITWDIFLTPYLEYCLLAQFSHRRSEKMACEITNFFKQIHNSNTYSNTPINTSLAKNTNPNNLNYKL
uniref:Uncharacterized protein n=1 Tax=Arundo donax TaxID=35708 RepID=A0A0A8Z8E4_ARUDO